MSIVTIILIITAAATALIAGLFYSYSCSVNPGLGRLPDAGYLAAMQSINRAILNPVFFMSFMGTLILLPLSTFLHYRQAGSPGALLLLLATLVYAIGTFGVTMAGNVPLNNALDVVDLQAASPAQLAAYRANFEVSWNKLHTIRTIAAVASLVLVIIACIGMPNNGERK